MRIYSKVKKRIYKIKKFLYYFNISINIIKKLKGLGVTNAKPLKYKRWHTGFCYFTAQYRNEKVFVKVDTQLKFLSNEKLFYDEFTSELENFLIPLRLFREFPTFQIAVFKYIPKSLPLTETYLINNSDSLREILEILIKINEKKVIHRDIKIDNFMLDNGKLKIIDFTFVNSFVNNRYKELDISRLEQKEILRELGGWEKISDYEWNDFHSLKIIIEKLLENNNISDVKIKEIHEYLNSTKKLILNSTYKLEEIEINEVKLCHE